MALADDGDTVEIHETACPLSKQTGPQCRCSPTVHVVRRGKA
jgi:hypothetical protein